MKKIVVFVLFLLMVMCAYSLDSVKRSYEKATVIDVINASVEPEPFEKDSVDKKIRMMIKIDSGKLKEKRLIIEYPVYNGDKSSMKFEREDKLVLEIEEDNGMKYYNIISKDNSGKMLWAILAALIFMIMVGKREGAKSLLTAGINFAMLGIFVTQTIIGGFPVFAALIIYAFLYSLISIHLMCGISKKGKAAFFGTIGTVIAALVVTVVYEKNFMTSGYSIFDINELFDSFHGINIRQILTAGIIIGVLGSIINIAVTIAEETDEVYLEHIGTKKINYFSSAMKSGQKNLFKIANSASTALVGAMILIFVFFMMKNGGISFIKLINREFFMEEFMRNLITCVTIASAIPITSFFAKMIYGKARS